MQNNLHLSVRWSAVRLDKNLQEKSCYSTRPQLKHINSQWLKQYGSGPGIKQINRTKQNTKNRLNYSYKLLLWQNWCVKLINYLTKNFRKKLS